MSLKNCKIRFFIALFLSSALAFSQGRGAIFDEQYDNLPRKAELAARSYEGMPASFSLRQYAPLPGDQEDYGTCVAWAAVYAARTICESVALNRQDQTETTQNVFSPVFVYRNIMPDDPACLMGTQIYSALDYMKDTGAVKMLEAERGISFPRVDLADYRKVRKYPIADYVTLFSREDRQKQALITRTVKKSLVERKPVIIGMNTPDSFIDVKKVWKPSESPDYFYYGHAMCVTGYDDEKYGGAFEVLNSWGRKWGNGGYIWIPYDTFTAFVTEAYEIIENISNFSDTSRFDSFIKTEAHEGEGETRTVSFNLNRNGCYTAAETFTENSSLNFTIGAKENAYVYSFTVLQPHGDSAFYSPALLFPKTGVFALLNYSDSEIILPEIKPDSSGTKYLVTLFSKQPLDIQKIMSVFISANGSINKRLASAAGDGYTTELNYDEKSVSFSGTLGNRQTSAAIVIAVTQP